MSSNLCPPPAHLRLATSVSWAELASGAPHAVPRARGSSARSAGIRYERKAQAHLQDAFPLHYASGPWLRYRNRNEQNLRWCQPDGLLVDFAHSLITIVEIKLRHTSDAWWQIRRLYEPVLRRLFDGFGLDFAALEFVRWYDPHTSFPEAHRLVRDPQRLSAGEFGVHIWTGRPA